MLANREETMKETGHDDDQRATKAKKDETTQEAGQPDPKKTMKLVLVLVRVVFLDALRKRGEEKGQLEVDDASSSSERREKNRKRATSETHLETLTDAMRSTVEIKSKEGKGVSDRATRQQSKHDASNGDE